MNALPLPLRLRRAFFIALLLGLWAPFKIAWEINIAHAQDQLRYQGVAMTRHLRDQLGQGLTIGVLSGMRSVVADFLWLEVTIDWEQKKWFTIEGYINLCTALQPRSITFWDIGAWQLAWNVSVSAFQDRSQSDLRRFKDSRFWIDRGRDLLLRGIENNPEHYKLWASLGLLYQNRLADPDRRLGLTARANEEFRLAAYYYAQANLRPDAPVFLERFPAYMYENAGDYSDAYTQWKALWFKLTPQQKSQPQHAIDKVEAGLRKAEAKLSIPLEKRIFPK